jgi:hypothetical protein
MKRLALLPVIALALAACSDTATSPTAVKVDRPLLVVSPGTYTGTIVDEFAPSGAHLQTGSISCTVATDLSITCSTYELAGVGHTNVDVTLIANYTAIVDCYNPGAANQNNPIESHTTTFSAERSETIPSTKNGRLVVPTETVDPDLVAQGCPNPNWTPTIREGTLVLQSFSYTVVFEGFEPNAAITISAS